MTMLNETTIRTEALTLVWDNASKQNVDKQTGKINWGVTVAIPRNSATYKEMRAAADAATAKAYPTGKPFKFKDWEAEFDPAKYPEFSPAEYVFARFSSKDAKVTFNGTQEVAREEFGRLAYPGAKVAVVGRVWCYMPDEKTANQTGIKWFYEGVQLVDATTPRLSISSGMSSADVANAFGAQPSAASAFTSAPAAAPVAQPTPPAASTPVAPNPGIVPPVPTAKMTTAGQTVESFLAVGWTVEQMRADGWVV